MVKRTCAFCNLPTGRKNWRKTKSGEFYHLRCIFEKTQKLDRISVKTFFKQIFPYSKLGFRWSCACYHVTGHECKSEKQIALNDQNNPLELCKPCLKDCLRA
jgi:hypothetical protein